MYIKNTHDYSKYLSWNDAKQVTVTALLFCGIVLLFSMTPIINVWAAESADTESYENFDARWYPWVGSWSMVSDRTNKNESLLNNEYYITLSPGKDGSTIIMKGHQDEKVIVKEELIADGLKHPLNDKKCSGYYKYTWSENGKRLLLESESSCPGDPLRKISGMSFIDENNDWLDIQFMENEKEKAVSIRKYRVIDGDDVVFGRLNPGKVRMARIDAGRSFSIDEIKELSTRLETEVIEAALLELRKPFPVDSNTLADLSDSGVPSRITDLMVALSFPDKFTVEQDSISLVKETAPPVSDNRFRWPYTYYSYHCPILPWHWASYSHMYYYYDYSYMGWYIADGRYYYPLWYSPYYHYPTDWWVNRGGSDNIKGHGKLIKGRGYKKTTSGSSAGSSSGSSSRYAAPRNSKVKARSTSSSGGTVQVQSSSSSNSSSSETSRATTSTSPSASPRGYRKGR